MDPINQTGGKSNKGLYIAIGVLVLILVVVLLKGSMTQKVNVGGYNAEYSKNFDGSTTVKSDYGTVTTGGNRLPDNWPSDAPIYKNAVITNSVALDPTYTGTTGSNVMFTTTDSIPMITDFYKNELASNGWKVLNQGTTMGANTIISAMKDSRTFTAVIMNGSTIKVMVTIGSQATKSPTAPNPQSTTIPNIR